MLQIFNLTEMTTLLRKRLLEEDSANSAWNATDGATFLTQMLNQSLWEFCTAYPFSWMETEAELTTTYTQVSATGATGSTINVDSTSGFGPGVVGWIFDSTNYERFTVSSIAALAITTASALTNTYAEDSHVVREYFDLPYNFFQPYSVRVVTAGYERRLKPRLVHKFDHDRPSYRASGTPRNYLIWGLDRQREPATGTYTAAAATDPDELKYGSFASQEADYYNGWLAINVGRSSHVRVLDYTPGSPGTLLMAENVTDQAAADTFYLLKEKKTIFLDVLCDRAYRLRFRFFRHPARLIAGTDIPEVPGLYVPNIVDGAVGYALVQDGQEARASGFFKSFSDAVERAWLLFGCKEGMDNMPSMWKANDDYAGSDDADT